MLKLVHSNRVDVLLARLIDDHEAMLAAGKLGVFDAYQVVVPSSGFRIWLTRAFAQELSVCAQINMQLWGTYRWGLERSVLEATPRDQLPTRLRARPLSSLTGVLSSSTMRFRLLGFFLSKTAESSRLWQALASSELSFDAARFVSTELSRVFSDYLTHRPEWLRGWSESDQPLDTEQMLRRLNQLRARFTEPAELSESELERTKALEKAQRQIWRLVFAEDHLDLLSVETLFWQQLESGAADSLPPQIAIMTEERLPRSGLKFLLRLSAYVDVLFLNQTPSREFFGDIADPLWLKEQALLSPDDFDQQQREVGHPLLARLGKQARDRFRLLAGLSGNSLSGDQIDNEDWFVAPVHEPMVEQNVSSYELLEESDLPKLSALELIQSGICTLNPELRPSPRPPSAADPDSINWADPSLRINACADLVRELEVLREDLALWLHEDPSRQPNDIAVLVPNLEEHAFTIEALLPASAEDGIRLPMRLTGLSDQKLIKVWQAYLGRFHLQDQLSLPRLVEWLNLPEVQAQWGLSADTTERACELLIQAGFRRTLNRRALSADLSHFDGDSRHTLEGALMRLCLGLLGPSDTYVADQHLSTPVPLGDGPLVQILVQIYAVFEQNTLLLDQSRPLTGADTKGLSRSNAHFSNHWPESADSSIDLNTEPSDESVGGWLDAVLIPDLKRLASDLQSSELTRIVQIAVQLSKTCGTDQTLPGGGKVKLSQALSLLDEAIGTQTLGAEPAHAITVCPLGTLRNMPFKLIVMLHLSAKSFSAPHTVSYLNLMRYEPQRLGDLQREEDQSAAFLEGLLAAKEAFWIYYPSQSTAAEPELPAHPVMDLGAFLVGGEADPRELSEQLRAAGWLAEHSKNPMNMDNYSGLGARRAGFWWRLTQSEPVGTQTPKRFADGSLSLLKLIHDPTGHDQDQLEVLEQMRAEHQPGLPEVLELQDLLFGLKKPDRIFYRAAKLMQVTSSNRLTELEDLDMNQLTLFGARQLLKDQIVCEHSDSTKTGMGDRIRLNPKLNEVRAAGYSGLAALEQLHRIAERQLSHAASQLGDQISFDPELKSTLLPIGATELWANLPHQRCHWLMQVAGKFDSHKWRLDAYLTHLAWQVHQSELAAGLPLASYALFSCGKLVRLTPLNRAEASERLRRWIALYALMQDQALSLPINHSLKAAEKWQHEPPSTKSVDAHWRKATEYRFDESSEDASWSTITRGRPANLALLEDLTPYQDLYAQVSTVFEDVDGNQG